MGYDRVGDGLPHIDDVPGAEGTACDRERIVHAPLHSKGFLATGLFPVRVPDDASQQHALAKAYHPGMAAVRNIHHGVMGYALFVNKHDVSVVIGRPAAGGGQGHRHAVPGLDDRPLVQGHRHRQILLREANRRQGCQPGQDGQDRQEEDQRPNGCFFHTNSPPFFNKAFL